MAFVSWQLQLRFSSHLYRYRRLRARQRLSSRRPSAFGPASFFRVKWSCDERGPAQLAIVLTGCPLESPELHRIPRLSLSDLHLKWQVLIFFFIFKILLVGIKGNIYILKSIMLVSGDWRDDGFFLRFPWTFRFTLDRFDFLLFLRAFSHVGWVFWSTEYKKRGEWVSELHAPPTTLRGWHHHLS